MAISRSASALVSSDHGDRDPADFTEYEQRVLLRFVERSLATATEEADRMSAGS